MTQWEKISGGTLADYKWIPKDEGDSLEGRFLEKTEHVTSDDLTFYLIEDSTGQTASVLGNTVLDTKLKSVAIGKMVKIVFLGSKPSQKRRGKFYKDFDVFKGIDSSEENERGL